MIPTEKKLSFLALGDSYTVGEMVETSQRWTIQLIQLFAQKNILFHQPVTIAHTGWTTDELINAIAQTKPTGKFDLVSLLIGVNNQYRKYSIENYRKEFVALLNDAIKFADNKKNRVVVVSIPDWSFSAFAEKDSRGIAEISNEIAEFNLIKFEEAKRVGVHYVNITPLSQNHTPSMFASDQLHPSGTQYALWANEIFKEIEKEFA